jgi:hypothetical protein
VSFTINVKDKLPVGSFSDKNFVIQATAKMDTSSVPISLRGMQLAGSDMLETKLNSKIVFSAKGFYHDNLIPNSGPLPPRVGQQTTYTIYWQVINIGNDLENVTIESYSPTYVRWLGNYQPGSADISYTESTGKIIWKIDNLAANTGILTPVKQIAFQVGLMPATNQVGNKVEIIKNSFLSGKDLFTDSALEANSGSIYSDLPDDGNMGDHDGEVVY